MEPTEVTAAVISGFAVAWAMTTLGIPSIPSIMVGLIIWASLTGKYRRRWAMPTPPPPETT